MPEERLTLCLAGHVYFTKGKYSETIPAEMETADVRRALTRLAEYENACFDDDGNEAVDTHAIHVLRGGKHESPRPDWTPCAEGLPTPDTEENGVRKRYLCTTSTPSGKFVVVELIYITVGEKPVWYDNDYYELFEGSGYQVTAWMPRPEPYNPDRKEDANSDDVSQWPEWKQRAALSNYKFENADHIVGANKKVDQVCPVCNSMAHYDPHFGRVMCRQCGWMQEDTK